MSKYKIRFILMDNDGSIITGKRLLRLFLYSLLFFALFSIIAFFCIKATTRG